MSSKGLLLASGGTDSVTVLYEHSKDIDSILFFDYGQIVYVNEYEILKRHAKSLKKNLIQIDVKDIYDGRLVSPLIDGDIKEGSIFEVPYRNMILLSIAAATAEINGHEVIYTGIIKTAYKDTSKDFTDSLQKVMATIGDIKLIHPFQKLDKHEVIKLAVKKHKINVAKETFSCYTNNQGLRHCGECPACIARYESFKKLNLKDKTDYIRKFGD